MDQIPYSLLFSVALLFFFFFFFKRFRNSNSLDKNKKFPPQPWKLPVLGHLHHLLGDMPHRALANLAGKLGPVFGIQVGEFSAVVISSPFFAKEVMKTHDLAFSNRPQILTGEIIGYNYTDVAFSPYGEYWRQMRKICVLELLSTKKVQSFRSLREEESWNLVEHISMQTSKPINLTEKIFTMVNTITCRVAVGSRLKDQETLIASFHEILHLSGGFDVNDIFPSIKILLLITGKRNKLVKAHQNIDQIFDSIISDHQQRRAGETSNQNEDLLDVLLSIKDDGGLEFPLTADNIKAVILDMFIGGTDTSSVTIEWAMSELMKNPKVMKKLQAELRHALKGKKKINESDIQEIDYLKLVIKETLRLHPPGILIPRECRETCEIGGYHIPIKTKILINVWQIGRDMNSWTEPESFIPERFSKSSISMNETSFEYLPFGAGRRMCPGLILGLANIELPLAMLLYRFNWELPDGATSLDFDMSEAFGATLKRKNKLLLVPSVYNTN